MPRRKREVGPLPTTSLVASATRYRGDQTAARIYDGHGKEWQRACYRHVQICGEARFAAHYFAQAMSRCTLHTMRKNGDRHERTSGTPGAEALQALFNGPEGQAEMLESIGTHLVIAGECYLVGRTVEDAAQQESEVWEVFSIEEIKVLGNKWAISYGSGYKDIPLKADDVVIRIWIPSPDHKMQADSPFRSLLPVLDEIEWLTKHIFAQTRSRLTGAGILWVPSEIEFPPPPVKEGEQPPPNKAAAFVQLLGDEMLTPIEDQGDPAAVIPIVATAPGEHLDKPRLMHFWSDLDSNALSMRAAAVERFALGMDMPKEQVLGMSSNSGTGGGNSNGVSHWGAWQIDESTIKMHIEPMLGRVANAITMAYLRPVSNTDELVGFDTTNLKLRPDRSRESIELWDRGQLSTAAMLRENGFDPDDAPDEAEIALWLLRKAATGSTTPEQVADAMRQLGVRIDSGEVPREERPTPSLLDHPERPRTPELLAACDALVYRALERAGNRLRQGGVQPPGVPSWQTHQYAKVNGNASAVLSDAWSCAPQVLAGIGDPEQVVPVLNRYVTALLTEASPHSRDRLAQWLDAAVL